MSGTSPLETLFFDCLRIHSPEDRAAYLVRACAGDAPLERRVRKMLEAHGSSFLEQAAFVPETGTPPLATPDLPGLRIGAYRLVEQIGEGGMGTVWRAEQLEPVHRQVALKLIKAGMDSRQVIARFETERQALALMEHPNIARVLDGGADAAGRPYFVMDLFAGVPITTYCDEARLSVRQRLELFVQVCDAIQHAHQKGVIHRDIKPSNVLVALQDGRAVPKVIDFGLAKAIERKGPEPSPLTQQGGFVGTLEYMSPEQALGRAGSLDTRTDIYSLGVLLYELLTGTTPLSLQRLARASYPEILRAVADEETPRPSTRLEESGGELASISALRRVAPARLANLVRGDLDWIVMKALEKERDRRYATAAEFGQDVQRFLDDEPVLACPPSAGYRLRKFAKRNRGALAAACVLLAALLVGIAAVGWAMRDRSARATDAKRQHDERQARVAAAVNELLDAADRQLAAQAWPEALATVRRADAAATNGEADTPTVEKVRVLLRDLEFVQELESIRSRQSIWSTGGFDSAAGAREYAEAFHAQGIDFATLEEPATIDRLKRTPELAVPLAAALAEWARRQGKDMHGRRRLETLANAIDTDPTRCQLRSIWWNPEQNAVERIEELVETIDVRAHPPVTLISMAQALDVLGRQAAGHRLLRKAQLVHPGDFWLCFEAGTAMSAEKDLEAAIRYDCAAVAIRPDSPAAYSNLGHALLQHNDVDEGIACLKRAIELDPNLPMPYVNMGRALLDLNKPLEALVPVRKALELDPRSALAWLGLGTALLEANRLDEADDAFRRSLELDPKNVHSLCGVSNVLRARHKLPEAVAAARAAIAAEPEQASGYISLGNALTEEGKHAEGAAAFRKAIEFDPQDAVAHVNLGNSLSHDPAKHEEAVAECRRSVELNPGYALGHYGLANALLQSRPEEAVAEYRRAIELGANFALAHFSLGQALGMLKRTDEAIVPLRKAIELDPDCLPACRRLAATYFGREEFAEAEPLLRAVVRLAPKDADAHQSLAYVLAKLDRHDEAIEEYRRSADLEPGKAQRHLLLGITLHGRRRYGEAVAAYRRCIEVDPKCAMAYGVLGDVLHLLEKDDEAVEAYRGAVAIDPKYDEAFHGLGIALANLRKYAEAIAAMEQSLALEPASADALADLAFLLAMCPETRLRDATRALELAQRAVEREPGRTRSRALGAALYRAGRWKDARAALQLAGENDAQSVLLAAMADWQLGDHAAACAAYTRVADAMARANPRGADVRSVAHEAAQLLGVESGSH